MDGHAECHLDDSAVVVHLLARLARQLVPHSVHSEPPLDPVGGAQLGAPPVHAAVLLEVAVRDRRRVCRDLGALGQHLVGRGAGAGTVRRRRRRLRRRLRVGTAVAGYHPRCQPRALSLVFGALGVAQQALEIAPQLGQVRGGRDEQHDGGDVVAHG